MSSNKVRIVNPATGVEITTERVSSPRATPMRPTSPPSPSYSRRSYTPPVTAFDRQSGSPPKHSFAQILDTARNIPRELTPPNGVSLDLRELIGQQFSISMPDAPTYVICSDDSQVEGWRALERVGGAVLATAV